MFVHVLKIPTSSINHTWDVFIKHVCIDTKKIHVCITSLPLHIVFFCAIPSRPNHPNFRTKKYTPQKKTQKLNFFPITIPTSEKKKSDPCNWTYSKLRRKKKKHDTFAFPGTRLKTTENWSFRRSQIDLRAISFVDSFLVKFGLKFYNVYNVSEIAPLPVRMLSKNVLLCVLCFRDMKKS